MFTLRLTQRFQIEADVLHENVYEYKIQLHVHLRIYVLIRHLFGALTKSKSFQKMIKAPTFICCLLILPLPLQTAHFSTILTNDLVVVGVVAVPAFISLGGGSEGVIKKSSKMKEIPEDDKPREDREKSKERFPDEGGVKGGKGLRGA